MSLAGSLLERLGWLRRSSTLRLSLLLSTVFAIGMAVAIFVALWLGEEALTQRIDATLETVASTTTLQEATGQNTSVMVRSVQDLDDLPGPFQRVVRRGGGTVDLERDYRGQDTWRVLVTRDSDGTPIFVALPLDDSEEALELLEGIVWSTALLVIASALAIGLGAGLLARRRLVRINDALDRLAAGDLSARTGHSRARDDLDDIARRVDTTATELERLVAQTRHLSASIAHDLRTPLARLSARLEMVPQGEARDAALEEARRLSEIFSTIMRVARIEATQGTEGFEDVDLKAFIEDLAETFGPVVEDAGKQLQVVVSAPAVVPADQQMLVQAVANLIQNALVHGGPEIVLFVNGREIGVADTGAGVDPALYGEIIKPMVRLDAARSTEGTGLGLALVRAVADRHGAELSLSPHAPQGLRVGLKFADL